MERMVFMKKEYLDQPTKGVWCRLTRTYPINNHTQQQPIVMTRQGNAAFPPSPNIKRQKNIAFEGQSLDENKEVTVIQHEVEEISLDSKKLVLKRK